MSHRRFRDHWRPEVLGALLATAGLYQIVDWARKGLGGMRGQPRGLKDPAVGLGDFRVELGLDRWTLGADLGTTHEVGGFIWILVEGPLPSLSRGKMETRNKTLAFYLPPGPPGTYRFWIVSSRKRVETMHSLQRRIATAVIAGEFHVPIHSEGDRPTS